MLKDIMGGGRPASHPYSPAPVLLVKHRQILFHWTIKCKYKMSDPLVKTDHHFRKSLGKPGDFLKWSDIFEIFISMNTCIQNTTQLFTLLRNTPGMGPGRADQLPGKGWGATKFELIPKFVHPSCTPSRLSLGGHLPSHSIHEITYTETFKGRLALALFRCIWKWSKR